MPYAFGLLVIATIGFLLYLRSVDSRRRYQCAACGETQRVELMTASHCNCCGAPLDPTEPNS